MSNKLTTAVARVHDTLIFYAQIREQALQNEEFLVEQLAEVLLHIDETVGRLELKIGKCAVPSVKGQDRQN